MGVQVSSRWLSLYYVHYTIFVLNLCDRVTRAIGVCTRYRGIRWIEVNADVCALLLCYILKLRLRRAKPHSPKQEDNIETQYQACSKDNRVKSKLCLRIVVLDRTYDGKILTCEQ